MNNSNYLAVKVRNSSAEKKKNEVMLVVVSTLMSLGVKSGEISYSRARAEYGDWFGDAVKSGKLLPCRVSSKKGNRRWFSLADIFALKAEEYEQLNRLV